MICLVCRQSETLDGLTSVNFERGEMRFVVNSVPARVCRGCGEAYVQEDVAVKLLQGAKKISDMGKLQETMEYNQLPWANS